jgi:tetratricopeptide (TPR) repeat protein
MAKAAKKPATTPSKKAPQKSPQKKASSSSRTPVSLDKPRATEGMDLAEKISWYALLATVLLVPIVMSNWTWLGFKLPITYDQFDIMKVFFQRVLGCIALGAWAWHMLTKGGKIRHTPVDWLILVFLAWVALSMGFSISPWTAFFGKYRRFEGLLSFINYAVFYFLVLQFADRPSRVRQIAETLFWSSFVVAGYGFLQRIGHDPINWHALPFEQFRPFSTYGNPDLLGGFLMFSVPIALALALAEENLVVRLIYWFGFGLNAYILIVSFTRGAWIGGAIAIVLMAFVAWRHTTKDSRIVEPVDAIPVGLTVVAGLVAIVRSLSSQNQVMNFGTRFASIFNLGEGSGLTRTEIWQAAIKAILADPKRFILGYGADTFRLVFPKFKPLAYTRDAGYLSVADNVHDYPLQLAAGIGVVGVALMYGIFVWAAIRSARLVFGKSGDRNRVLLAGFWVAAAAYLVQLLFGLSVTGNTFLLWICMGAVLAPTAASIEVEAPDWGMLAGAIVMVLAVLGIAYQVVLMAADYNYLISEVSMDSDPQTAVATAQIAAELNPVNDMYLAQVGMSQRELLSGIGNSFYSAQQSGQNTTQYIQPMQNAFDAAIAGFERTISFVPDEYDNYVFISSTYNVGAALLSNPSYYKEAEYWAQLGIKVEPYGPAIRTQYADALLGEGRTQEAIKVLEYAYSMDKNNADAGRTLATAYASAGRVNDGIKILQDLIARGTTDQSVSQVLQQLQQRQGQTSTPPAGKGATP